MKIPVSWSLVCGLILMVGYAEKGMGMKRETKISTDALENWARQEDARKKVEDVRNVLNALKEAIKTMDPEDRRVVEGMVQDLVSSQEELEQDSAISMGNKRPNYGADS